MVNVEDTKRAITWNLVCHVSLSVYVNSVGKERVTGVEFSCRWEEAQSGRVSAHLCTGQEGQRCRVLRGLPGMSQAVRQGWGRQDASRWAHTYSAFSRLVDQHLYAQNNWLEHHLISANMEAMHNCDGAISIERNWLGWTPTYFLKLFCSVP